MSSNSIKIAKQYGEKLPKFADLKSAETYFFDLKNKTLSNLEKLSLKILDFSYDLSIESLNNLERKYYELVSNNSFANLQITKNDFEEFMRFYFGEVVVRNNKEAEWVVQEYAFEKDKYEVGVKKKLMVFTLTNYAKNLYEKSNKFKSKLLSDYKRFFLKK